MPIEAGEVLADRFEVLGVVGRGGMSTVYLVSDRLRGERIALKVVHDHLAADPSVRRRLNREVLAANVIRCDAALVPHDLHEIGGRLALSMPFHRGQTLEERVAASGPLPLEEVRTIGLRIARALAEAHRAGVLHRDVTASNILTSEGGADAVLTDFGLARLRHGSTARSTGLLGTAGYAAPEVYAGDRADPRSDLYGLGAALYLAVTGRPAFEASDPMAALKLQLEDGIAPVRAVRPEVPAPLAELIEALLLRDPAARPQGAREVCDLLELGHAPEAPPEPSSAVIRQHLPPGDWTVVIRERDEDRGRRTRARVERRRASPTAESELHRGWQSLVSGVRDLLGMPASEERTPEERLSDRLAEEAGLAPGSLALPPVIFDRRFRLIDRTDEATAHRLADAAQDNGFRAHAVRIGQPQDALDLLATYFWVPIAVGWSTSPFLIGLASHVLPVAVEDVLSLLMIPSLIAMSIALPVWASARGRREPRAQRLPAAYRADLTEALTIEGAAPPRYAVGIQEPTGVAEPLTPEAPPSRGQLLLARAEAALRSLQEIAESDALQLPRPARRDLQATVRELHRSATELSAQVDQLQRALSRTGAPEEEVALLRARRDRLQTLQRAGEIVDDAELGRLDRAIAEHEADLAAEAAVEARMASTTAQLLEIASTASRVRRELLAEPEPEHTTAQGVDRLRREVRAADAARREAAATAARRPG
ncbi:MAG TPA: hypothetical protein ENK18_25040 [Deltaproteobacteria bacterium]|nr:hypothetical protein [Deltaproteobacteria bacterium]